MRAFRHLDEVRRDFPELAAGVVRVEGITADVSAEARVAAFLAVADARLDGRAESELPEVRAWRRVFSRMGLKPTQYRCASEALLRRYRVERVMPRVHPLVDLCNAVSMAFGVPVAALDLDRVEGSLEVRYARGDEVYHTFAGGTEHPNPGEVVFADAAHRAHARRWTNRQSGYSAVRDGTEAVLIVAEAVHDTAVADVRELTAVLAGEVAGLWSVEPRSAVLDADGARFDLGGG
ncbi:B3/B4 domain-containing protein [Saccharothrix syringae]|uniref:B3/B4 tRNA-binding domain-containing protein n=1 Tax=Saccharothrix syringae TaxID=103733 RepID=A0A5Q0H6E9_SACSY|nr:phenylalanine--tRNA ligase beta subunit-related protein [Saccharothrix syringae]QFZ21514.1 hypothetical protein EKG83_32660 [Saccharothrix syringae]